MSNFLIFNPISLPCFLDVVLHTTFPLLLSLVVAVSIKASIKLFSILTSVVLGSFMLLLDFRLSWFGRLHNLHASFGYWFWIISFLMICFVRKATEDDTLYNGVVLRWTSLKHFGLFNDPLVFQGNVLGHDFEIKNCRKPPCLRLFSLFLIPQTIDAVVFIILLSNYFMFHRC